MKTVEKPATLDAWRSDPPDSEGLWWLYGEVEFGTLGGNYTGVFPVEVRLNVVVVKQLGSGLAGVCNGQFVRLTPFDREQHRAGYVGLWQKVNLPALPPNIELPHEQG